MASTTETELATQQANSASRKVDLRERDEFYKETYRFFDALGRHRTAVIVAAVALVGACIAAGIVANRHEARGEEAKSALFLAEKAYDTELKALAGVKPPTTEADDAEDKAADAADGKVADKAPLDAKAKKAKEDSQKAKREEEAAASKKMEELSFSKIDVDAKFPEAIKKYGEVISKFGGTRAALEARMSLGALYFNHGEPAKAAAVYKDASQAASGSFERSVAFQSWGYALENDGKYAEAIAAYEKALNYGEGSIKGDVWLGIARSQEAMHDAAKARSTYDQIITQLPNTDAAKAAESLKARL